MEQGQHPKLLLSKKKRITSCSTQKRPPVFPSGNVRNNNSKWHARAWKKAKDGIDESNRGKNVRIWKRTITMLRKILGKKIDTGTIRNWKGGKKWKRRAIQSMLDIRRERHRIYWMTIQPTEHWLYRIPKRGRKHCILARDTTRGQICDVVRTWNIKQTQINVKRTGNHEKLFQSAKQSGRPGAFTLPGWNESLAIHKNINPWIPDRVLDRWQNIYKSQGLFNSNVVRDWRVIPVVRDTTRKSARERPFPGKPRSIGIKSHRAMKLWAPGEKTLPRF